MKSTECFVFFFLKKKKEIELIFLLPFGLMCLLSRLFFFYTAALNQSFHWRLFNLGRRRNQDLIQQCWKNTATSVLCSTLSLRISFLNSVSKRVTPSAKERSSSAEPHPAQPWYISRLLMFANRLRELNHLAVGISTLYLVLNIIEMNYIINIPPECR